MTSCLPVASSRSDEYDDDDDEGAQSNARCEQRPAPFAGLAARAFGRPPPRREERSCADPRPVDAEFIAIPRRVRSSPPSCAPPSLSRAYRR